MKIYIVFKTYNVTLSICFILVVMITKLYQPLITNIVKFMQV